MTNPLDDYLGQEKRAFLGQSMRTFGQSFAPAVAQGAAGALAAASIAGSVVGAKALYNAATANRDMRAMMAANPELKSVQKEDPKRFNLLYSSLRNMNPQYSKDPIVAGSFMKRMADPYADPGGFLVEALQGTRNADTTMMDAIRGGAQAGIASGVRPSDLEEKLEVEKYKADRMAATGEASFERQQQARQEEDSLKFQRGLAMERAKKYTPGRVLGPDEIAQARWGHHMPDRSPSPGHSAGALRAGAGAGRPQNAAERSLMRRIDRAFGR